MACRKVIPQERARLLASLFARLDTYLLVLQPLTELHLRCDGRQSSIKTRETPEDAPLGSALFRGELAGLISRTFLRLLKKYCCRQSAVNLTRPLSPRRAEKRATCLSRPSISFPSPRLLRKSHHNNSASWPLGQCQLQVSQVYTEIYATAWWRRACAFLWKLTASVSLVQQKQSQCGQPS